MDPTTSPTANPSKSPTGSPTDSPTSSPTGSPTASPSCPICEETGAPCCDTCVTTGPPAGRGCIARRRTTSEIQTLERGSDDDDDDDDPNTQKLASKDKVEKPKELSNASSGLPVVDKSRRRTSSEKRRSYSFLDPTGPICNKEVNKEMADGKLGQSDYQCSEDDVSSGKYNCCLNSGDYSCETCATCRGYGQILNGIDEMGHSW
jgi:hypothetical protein